MFNLLLLRLNPSSCDYTKIVLPILDFQIGTFNKLIEDLDVYENVTMRKSALVKTIGAVIEQYWSTT